MVSNYRPFIFFVTEDRIQPSYERCPWFIHISLDTDLDSLARIHCFCYYTEKGKKDPASDMKSNNSTSASLQEQMTYLNGIIYDFQDRYGTTKR